MSETSPVMKQLPKKVNKNTNNKPKIVKEKFTEAEDSLLKFLVKQYGTNKWSLVGTMMKKRSARQCRDRWNHYLCDETLNTGEFTKEEDDQILDLYRDIGSKWTIIAKCFPDRNVVMVRNRCTRLLRRLNKKQKEKEKKKTKPIAYLKPNIPQEKNTKTKSYSSILSLFTFHV